MHNKETLNQTSGIDKTVGLLLGSFNPPHIGHIQTACTSKENGQLDEVWMVPIPCTIKKKSIAQAPFEHKIEMCKRAAHPHQDWLKVSDLAKNIQPDWTSTIQNLVMLSCELTRDHSNTVFHIIDGDQRKATKIIAGFMSWMAHAQKFMANPHKDTFYNLRVIEEMFSNLEKPAFINANYISRSHLASSSAIRAEISSGTHPTQIKSLFKDVSQYIVENNLYNPEKEVADIIQLPNINKQEYPTPVTSQRLQIQ